jgi:hypothetical protein
MLDDSVTGKERVGPEVPAASVRNDLSLNLRAGQPASRSAMSLAGATAR